MNHVAIFFVPTGATQHDFEIALREHFASVQIGEGSLRAKHDCVGITDNDHLPLWTWFGPNSNSPSKF
ncbi:MAG: hypothetical protein EPO07_08295 [Verrucomicrobia bacterium]|nr:MAG: hypothetical protein EPO07_08295 [Verrucomicrobiota bacterium]